MFSILKSSPFILDNISTPPTVAYSLRRLFARYSGPLINVRRSSDNATMDIGAVSSGALDINTLLSFTGASSAFVTKYYDQSVNGIHCSQSTATQQPRIVGLGVYDNGILFYPSGAASILRIGTISTLFPVQTVCYSISNTNSTSVNFDAALVHLSNESSPATNIPLPNGSTAGSTTVSAPFTGRFFTNGTLYTNNLGVPFFSIAGIKTFSILLDSPTVSTNWIIGDLFSNSWRGLINDVIIFSSALNVSQIRNIERDIARNNGIQLL